MAGRSGFLLEIAKMKNQAANAKPEKANFGESVSLNKALFDMQSHMSKLDRDIDDEAYDELSKKWSGQGGGGSGDAFITGLKSGLKKGSILEDKERMKKYMNSLSQMEEMVSNQNKQIYEQQQIFNAKQKLMPQANTLFNSPNITQDKFENGWNSIARKFSQMTGMNVQVVNPNRLTGEGTVIVDGDEQLMDLKDFFATPEMLAYKQFENSPEFKAAQKASEDEYALEQKNAKNVADLHEEQMKKLKKEREDLETANQFEKEHLKKTGDKITLLNTVGEGRYRQYEKEINTNREVAQAAFNVANDLDKLVKLAENHPSIFGSNMEFILMNKNNEDPNFWNSAARKLVPRKDRAAFNEATNLIKRLNADSLKSLGGGRMNVFLERNLFGGNPNMTWEADAVKTVGKDLSKKSKAIGNEYKKSVDYYSSFNPAYYKPKVIIDGFEEQQEKNSSQDDQNPPQNNQEEIVTFIVEGQPPINVPASNADEAERRLKGKYKNVVRKQ